MAKERPTQRLYVVVTGCNPIHVRILHVLYYPPLLKSIHTFSTAMRGKSTEQHSSAQHSSAQLNFIRVLDGQCRQRSEELRETSEESRFAHVTRIRHVQAGIGSS